MTSPSATTHGHRRAISRSWSVAVTAGTVAAVAPAHRANRLDVLRVIATDLQQPWARMLEFFERRRDEA